MAFVTTRSAPAPSTFWVRPPPHVLDAPSRNSHCARQVLRGSPHKFPHYVGQSSARKPSRKDRFSSALAGILVSVVCRGQCGSEEPLARLSPALRGWKKACNKRRVFFLRLLRLAAWKCWGKCSDTNWANWKSNNEEKILSRSRVKEQITEEGIPRRLSADFSAETLQARRGWHDIFKVEKGKNLQPKILYRARRFFQIQQRNQKTGKGSENSTGPHQLYNKD